MGNQNSMIDNFSCYKDIQYHIEYPNHNNYLLINTLNENEQDCLIKSTCPVYDEEKQMNHIITKSKNTKIIIYGKHNCDKSVFERYQQLKSLGLKNIYIYTGGLFEWLLLQDIYSHDHFPTTNINDIDILHFAPNRKQSLLKLSYN